MPKSRAEDEASEVPTDLTDDSSVYEVPAELDETALDDAGDEAPRARPPRSAALRLAAVVAVVLLVGGALLVYRAHHRGKVLAEGLSKADALLRLDTAAGYRQAASLLEHRDFRGMLPWTLATLAQALGARLLDASGNPLGPGGSALMIMTLSDNRNRTVSDIRATLSRHGGRMGESGSVGWMFDFKGIITLQAKGRDPDGGSETSPDRRGPATITVWMRISRNLPAPKRRCWFKRSTRMQNVSRWTQFHRTE